MYRSNSWSSELFLQLWSISLQNPSTLSQTVNTASAWLNCAGTASPLAHPLRQRYITPSLGGLSRCLLMHVNSHQELPGFIAEGNRVANAACYVAYDLLGAARSSHGQLHQSALALRQMFRISLGEARDIVQQCMACSQAMQLPEGVDPRGVSPNQLWQMDVTEYLPFGCLHHLHAVVDTCSGMLRSDSDPHTVWPLSGRLLLSSACRLRGKRTMAQDTGARCLPGGAPSGGFVIPQGSLGTVRAKLLSSGRTSHLNNSLTRLERGEGWTCLSCALRHSSYGLCTV